MSEADGLVGFRDWDALWHFAHRVARSCRAGDEAQDIAQQVSLEALALVRRGRAVNESWVYSCASSRAIDLQRSRSFRKQTESDYARQMQDSPRPVWLRTHPAFGDLVAEIKALLLLLPDNEQEVLRHLYIYAYSVRETIRRLHMRLSRLNAFRSHGIKELRRLAGVDAA